MQLHNFPSDRFSSGLLISFWRRSFFFFFVIVDIQVQLRGLDKGREVVLIEASTDRVDIRRQNFPSIPELDTDVVTITSGME